MIVYGAGNESRDVEVIFEKTGNSVCRYKAGKKPFVAVSDYLEDAPQDVIRDLVKFLFGKNGPCPAKFEEYVSSDAFVNAKRPLFLSRSRKFRYTAEGSVYNLHDSVRRLLDSGLVTESDVRNVYFTWTVRSAVRLLGTCYSMFRVISVSSALDSEDVPETHLDYVVYHEILHIRQGFHMKKIHHDAAFRIQENRYPDCRRIREELSRLDKRRLPLEALSYVISDAPDDSGGNSAGHDVFRNVSGYDRARGYYRIVADSHSAEDRSVRSYPDVSSQPDGGCQQFMSATWIQIVIDGRENDLMPDEASVADGYAALILKTASGVDENSLSDGYVFAEIGIDRGEEAEIIGYILAGKLRHKSAQLALLMESGVDFRGYPLSLSGIFSQDALSFFII